MQQLVVIQLAVLMILTPEILRHVSYVSGTKNPLSRKIFEGVFTQKERAEEGEL